MHLYKLLEKNKIVNEQLRSINNNHYEQIYGMNKLSNQDTRNVHYKTIYMETLGNVYALFRG